MTFNIPGKKYMVRGKDSDKCPCCGSKDIHLDREKYEAYCNKCGYVINEYSIEYGRPGLKKDINK